MACIDLKMAQFENEARRAVMLVTERTPPEEMDYRRLKRTQTGGENIHSAKFLPLEENHNQ
jgi:hypothetical protein